MNAFEIYTRFSCGGPDKQLKYHAFQLFDIRLSNGRLVERLYIEDHPAFSFEQHTYEQSQ